MRHLEVISKAVPVAQGGIDLNGVAAIISALAALLQSVSSAYQTVSSGKKGTPAT